MTYLKLDKKTKDYEMLKSSYDLLEDKYVNLEAKYNRLLCSIFHKSSEVRQFGAVYIAD